MQQFAPVIDDQAPTQAQQEDPRRKLRGESDILGAVESLLLLAFAQEGPPGDLEPEQLVTVVQGEPARQGAIPPRRPSFDLHHTSFDLNLTALLTADQLDFGNMRASVYASYRHAKNALEEVQPDATWAIVAAQVVTGTRKEIRMLRNPKHDASGASLDAIIGAQQGRGTLSVAKKTVSESRVATVEVVFANFSPDTLSDPNARLGARANPRMEQYLEHRDLRFLPQSLLDNRKEACRVIAEQYGVPEHRVVDEDGKVLSESEPRPTRAGASAETPATLTDEQLSMADALLKNGFAAGVVAKQLGVHHNTLKKALRDREAAGGGEDDDLGFS